MRRWHGGLALLGSLVAGLLTGCVGGDPSAPDCDAIAAALVARIDPGSTRSQNLPTTTWLRLLNHPTRRNLVEVDQFLRSIPKTAAARQPCESAGALLGAPSIARHESRIRPSRAMLGAPSLDTLATGIPLGFIRRMAAPRLPGVRSHRSFVIGRGHPARCNARE